MKKLVMVLVMLGAFSVISLKADMRELATKKQELEVNLYAHKNLLAQEKRTNPSSRNIASLQSVIKEIEAEIVKVDKQINQELANIEF